MAVAYDAAKRHCCPIGPIEQWQTIGPACGADVRCLAGSGQVAISVFVYHHLRFSRCVAVAKDATITPIRHCQPIGLPQRALSSCLAAQRERLFRVCDVALALANGVEERVVLANGVEERVVLPEDHLRTQRRRASGRVSGPHGWHCACT